MAIDSGAVNIVTAEPGFKPNHLAVVVCENEGAGEMHHFVIPWDSTMNIPTQVELFMMDFDCAATWRWNEDSLGRFIGEFAHFKNRKCVKDSGASDWDINNVSKWRL